MTEMPIAEPLTAPDASRPLPGPRGLPLLGSAGALRHGVLKMFDRWWRTHGDIYQVRIARQTWTLVCHPDGVRQILHEGRRQFIKGPIYDHFRLLGGEGLVSSEGERHLRDRRLMQPAFLRRNLPRFFDGMRVAVDDTAERLGRHDGPIEVHDEMVRLAMRMVGEALFGIDLTDEADTTAPAIHAALEVIADRSNAAVSAPIWLPTPGNRRLKRALADLHGAVDRIVAAGHGGRDDGRPTLLHALLDARDPETGVGFDDVDLRDQIVTLFIAGHETTALALTWTLHLLALDPHIQAEVHAEVDRVFADGPLTARRLAELVRLRQVIDESLRLRPPFWASARNCVEDSEVLGHRVRAGSIVIMPTYLIHRHPDFWPDAERFDPDRFDAQNAADHHRFAYLPFSASARRCIGDNFSMMELLLALATILRRFEVTAPDSARIEADPHLSLRPARPIRVGFRPRATASAAGGAP